MGLANNDVNVWQGVQDTAVTTLSNKSSFLRLSGQFTGEKDTEYNIVISELTSGLVTDMDFLVSSNVTGLTTGTYSNVATSAVSSSGTGLRLNIEIVSNVYSGAGTQSIHTAGTGYKVGDTVKVLGTALGGASPAADVTLKIISVNNSNLKYKVKKIVEGIDSGYGSLITPSVNINESDDLGYGISLAWSSFAPFKLGEKIVFSYYAHGSIASDMFCLKTKDGAHLIKFWNGALEVQHDIDKKLPIDPDNIPTNAKKDNRIGVVSQNSKHADFAQINSKSVSVGLGDSKATPPKWVGMQQYKQWDKELVKDKMIIEDAELKIPSDVPVLSDLVILDTSNWYNASGQKAGSAGAWTQDYIAGFIIGKPDLYLFRTHTDAFGAAFGVKSYIKYGVEDTQLVSPISIATDGPHLFVLDDVGGGLVHCYKFTGAEDSGDTDSPTISVFDKYNSNWPYPLPDTHAGITKQKTSTGVPCSGAYYTDIMVTPTDSRFNTSSGGQGKIFIQASWDFNQDNDYVKYNNEESTFTWEPPVTGHTEENEWLWSVDLANPAHPTGMTPQLNNNGRLRLENRSPALDKFYKINKVNIPSTSTRGAVLHNAVIRGDYDITSGGHPQETAGSASNMNGTNVFETPPIYLNNNGAGILVQKGGLGKKIDNKEAGVLQTFRFGLTDIGEATRIGVTCVYASSDLSRYGDSNFSKRKGHLQSESVLYAEIASSSAFYADSFLGGEFSTGHTVARDRLLLSGGNSGTPKEVELAAIPASQVVSFNIIDGTAAGFTKKPLIIPLAVDALKNGYNSADASLEEDFDFGAAYYNTEDRSLVMDNGRPSDVERVIYSRNTATNKSYLTTFLQDGTAITHDITTLYTANSLETGTGANGWLKDTFLYKNPFHKQLDNFASSAHAGKSASEHIPGGFAQDNTSTGLVQHPRINKVQAALNAGKDGAKIAYRDKTTRGSDRYDAVASATYASSGTLVSSNSSVWSDWELAYGGKRGDVRVFVLPHERTENTKAKIEFDKEQETRMWDYTPTKAVTYAFGVKYFVINQKKSQWSSLNLINLHAGVSPVSSSVGFLTQEPYLEITGFDNVGNGAPANNNARISSPVAAGTSDFIGWWKTAPDGSTDYTGDAVESQGPDYIYYSFSLVFDGHQESPLSTSLGSSVDSNSGWTVQTNKDALNIKIVINDIKNVSRRVSHINIYRSKNRKDVPFAKAFYQLVQQVSLDDVRWVEDGTTSDKWSCTIADSGRASETYETRTGVSELLENTMPHYGISAEGDGYLFVSQAWHQSLDEATNYIFRSKPGKFSVFDWSTDYLELPEYPSAISYYNGKLFAFSQSTTYMINPRTLIIEETFLQAGCLSNDTVVSSDYGMFWADNKSIWLYQGAKIQNVGLPIEQGMNASYRNRDNRADSVHVEFDALTKCFCVFHKPKKEYTTLTGDSVNEGQLVENSYQAAIWAFHIEKKRWDYWVLTDNVDNLKLGKPTFSTCRDWDGGIVYINKHGLFQLGTSEYRKAWHWISKNFVMGYPTLDKRFYKLRAVSQNGTPILEYKVDDAPLGLGVDTNEKISTKKGKRIKVAVRADGNTAVDSIGIIYRKPKAK